MHTWLSDAAWIVIDVVQFINNHQVVPETEYADPKGPIRLPASRFIPNVHLEVVNYHKPLLGTFHAKFMVVDRKHGLVQSDNIQDNDNLELALQLEGPIVDALYDTALITWHNALSPPMPCLSAPASAAPFPTFETESHRQLFDKGGNLMSSYQ
jgi:phosphatidylserine/phosphatidylglycerophosphate/cardiolipin synthase-like enzyme